ncbi:MAG: hypothetical protein WCC22_20990 [Terriglobales bacterium]
MFEGIEPEGSPLKSPVEVRSRLKKIAMEHASYATALAASAYFRESVGNVDIMAKDCNGKSSVDLSAMMRQQAEQERDRVSRELDDAKIDAFLQGFLKDLEESFAQDNDLWKSVVPGRQIFNVFAASVKLGASRLKTMYVREALKFNPSPFEDVVRIFERFAA